MKLADSLRRSCLQPIKELLRPSRRAIRFENSSDYWEERYRSGGNSGAGSYGRLAIFKANFLNHFVEQHGIASVIEFGSGDGNQLGFAEYPNYIGVDISPTIIARARERFASDPHITFMHASEVEENVQADLSMSLDVIYHLVEDDTFEAHMCQLFDAGRRFVIIYASDKEDKAPAPHVRHRKFTRWIEQNCKDFDLVEHVPNPFPFVPNDPQTSFADFFVYRRSCARQFRAMPPRSRVC